MKIRSGFVSNSSSSSFVIIGKRTSWEDLKIGDFVVGNYFQDGYDGFTISNKEMLDFVQEHSEQFSNFFTDVRLVESSVDDCDDVADNTVDRRDVGNQVYAIKKDYYSSDTIEKLKENYNQ